MGQFHDASHKTPNPKDTKYHEGLVSGVSFVYRRGLCGLQFCKLTHYERRSLPCKRVARREIVPRFQPSSR
jgi:hypothetical protein